MAHKQKCYMQLLRGIFFLVYVSHVFEKTVIPFIVGCRILSVSIRLKLLTVLFTPISLLILCLLVLLSIEKGI